MSAVSPPPEPLRVLKFGGAALATGEGVQRACRIVLERGGPRPVVVVSAHAGVTELLAAGGGAPPGGGGPPRGGGLLGGAGYSPPPPPPPHQR